MATQSVQDGRGEENEAVGNYLSESQHRRFVEEYERGRDAAGVEYGYCFCGCGNKTTVVPKTAVRDRIVAGMPHRYLRNHHRRSAGNLPGYVEEDCGYESPCWIWRGTINRDGYGILHRSGRGSNLAHVAYWEELHGPKNAELTLDHLCRQKACVRPDHLDLVYLAHNLRRGDLAKLDLEKVKAIKVLYDAGFNQSQIGRIVGVVGSTVWNVVHGKSWQAPRPVIRKKVPGKRLTADQVAEMRRLADEEGLGCRPLGKMYGVTASTVSLILRNKIWITPDKDRTWGQRRGLAYVPERSEQDRKASA